jgi:NADPH:quinone reductase-like Zn-dependent oxidoreductase
MRSAAGVIANKGVRTDRVSHSRPSWVVIAGREARASVLPMTATTDTMPALRLHEQEAPQAMVYESADRPVPGTGDVLVAVHAASFTPDELTWPSTWVDRSGHDRRPVIPCHEVSGVVVELGWGAAGVAPGDEVFGLTDWYRDGAAAGYVAVEARNVARKPRALSHVEAATLPLAGLTALQGLHDHGGLAPGQTVVVVGAGGGVGTMAVQLAKVAGARVIAAGRPRVADLAHRLGAEAFVDLTRPLPADLPRAALIFDMVGGAALEACLDLLEPGGRVVSAAEPPNAEQAAMREADALYFVVEPDRRGLAELAVLADVGRLQPVLGATTPLADAAATLARKPEGGVPGKVALVVRD